ncbi:17971_t:CDS:2, partial [Racocetra fulgida]
NTLFMSDIDNNKIGNKQQDVTNPSRNKISDNEHDDNFEDQSYTWLPSGEMLKLPTKIFKDNTLLLDEKQDQAIKCISPSHQAPAEQKEVFGPTNLKEIFEKENAKNKLETILPNSDIVSKASHALFLEKTTGSRTTTPREQDKYRIELKTNNKDPGPMWFTISHRYLGEDVRRIMGHQHNSQWLFSPMVISTKTPNSTSILFHSQQKHNELGIDRCIPHEVDQYIRLCQPTMSKDEQGNCEDHSRQSKSNTDLTSMDISPMVSPANQDNGIQTHNSPQVGDLTRQMLPDTPNKEY